MKNDLLATNDGMQALMFGPKSFYNICTESGLKSHWESKGSLGGSFMGTELFWICGGGYRNLYM